MPTAKRVSGPSLVAWLEGRGCKLGEKTLASHARTIRRWRDGEVNPTLFDVDAVLTKLDIHLDELPDELRPADPADAAQRDRGGVPKGYGAKLSDAQIRLLHRAHRERRVTVQMLAEQVWEQAGFASFESASWSIRRGFKRLGLEVIHHRARALGARRCNELNHRGEPCEGFAQSGSEVCWSHSEKNREKARAVALRNSPWAVAA